MSDEVLVRSLAALKSLLTGELLETLAPRLVNRDAHRDDLGPGRRLRKLRLLPRLWTALAEETDGLYADGLVSLLCAGEFRARKLASRVARELVRDVEDAIDAVSRCAAIKPAIRRRFLARLAAAAQSLPEQDSGGGDVLAFEDPAEPLDSVAVGHRLREWHCARCGSVRHGSAPRPTPWPCRAAPLRVASGPTPRGERPHSAWRAAPLRVASGLQISAVQRVAEPAAGGLSHAHPAEWQCAARQTEPAPRHPSAHASPASSSLEPRRARAHSRPYAPA